MCLLNELVQFRFLESFVDDTFMSILNLHPLILKFNILHNKYKYDYIFL